MDAVLNLMQEVLQKHDKVLLVTCFVAKEKWIRFCDVLSAIKEKYSDATLVFLIEKGIECPKGVNSIILSHEDAQKLHKLYLTYEFSDGFVVFSDSMRYGTIFNYVDAGILTEEEAVRAILS